MWVWTGSGRGDAAEEESTAVEFMKSGKPEAMIVARDDSGSQALTPTWVCHRHYRYRYRYR